MPYYRCSDEPLTSPRSLAALTALALLGAGAATTTTATAAHAATTTTTSLTTADVSVREDLPSANFGTTTRLRADGSPRAESYLRFQVAGHTTPITKATLQVYSYSASDHGFAARPVGDGWSEARTTWDNRPQPGAIVSTTGATREKTWADLDVTSLVKGDGSIDVALTSVSPHTREMASREAGPTRAARLVVESEATTSGPGPLRITPGGAGKRDGSSWANAGDLTDLPRFVEQRPAGGEIWVRGDAGPYRPTASIALRAGGTTSAPVVIRGVDGSGGASVRPVIVGTRSAPYSPTGAKGGEVFKLYSGANNLTFSNLAFSNEGTAFNAGGNSSNIVVSDVSATNVRRFFSNYLSSGETTANVNGLTLRRVKVDGFSKAVLRLDNDSSRVLLEDVTGDSQRQDRDDFAMGVHLGGTVHDVVLRRVTMRNAHDSLHTYWNGDGFATERGVTNVRFEDTLATGNTDGGYDLKSTRTTLVNARAQDNKRNFRFWAADTTVTGCTGLDPRLRGGSGSQSQVWLGANAAVTLNGCTLRDASPATIVFDLENGARLVASSTSISKDPQARMQRLGSGASVTIK